MFGSRGLSDVFQSPEDCLVVEACLTAFKVKTAVQESGLVAEACLTAFKVKTAVQESGLVVELSDGFQSQKSGLVVELSDSFQSQEIGLYGRNSSVNK